MPFVCLLLWGWTVVCVQVVGLVEHPTRDPHTALSLLAAGQQSRRTGSTQV